MGSFPFDLSLKTRGFGPRPDFPQNPNHLGLDFGKGAANQVGTAVKAAGSGTVDGRNHSSQYNHWVQIDHGGGWKTRYHMLRDNSGPPVGSFVAEGQVVGFIGPTYGVSSGVHLHMEIHQNGTAVDPELNIGNVPSAPPRYAVLGRDRTLRLKENSPWGGWVTLAHNVIDYDLAGSRIAYVDTGGNAFIKDGPHTAAWSHLWAGASQVILTESRTAVRTTSAELHVKEGSINAGWSLLATDVAQAAMAGNRVAVRSHGGLVRVKEGGLNAAWIDQTQAKDISITQNRIGVISPEGVARVKEGGLYAGWSENLTDADSKNIVLDGSRIGVLSSNGLLRVKDGATNSGWAPIENGVIYFDLSTDKVVWVRSNGTASLKQGHLHESFIEQTDGAQAFKVAN